MFQYVTAWLVCLCVCVHVYAALSQHQSVPLWTERCLKAVRLCTDTATYFSTSPPLSSSHLTLVLVIHLVFEPPPPPLLLHCTSQRGGLVWRLVFLERMWQSPCQSEESKLYFGIYVPSRLSNGQIYVLPLKLRHFQEKLERIQFRKMPQGDESLSPKHVLHNDTAVLSEWPTPPYICQSPTQWSVYKHTWPLWCCPASPGHGPGLASLQQLFWSMLLLGTVTCSDIPRN